jgi:uncharacterized delta-60 repeat protein
MRITTPLLLSVSLLRLVPSAGADGMLDPSFGNGGLVATDFGQFAQDSAASLVVLPDGRAVAVGNTSPNLASNGMAAVRYLVSGALDTTFGSGGLVTIYFPPPPGATEAGVGAESVLLQPDGRLVLIGGMGSSPPPANRFALARLNLDGSLDPSFGTGGRVTTLIGNWAVAYAGLLQPDGRIVAVGYLTSGGNIAAARYNTDGSLDPAFGSGGTVQLSQLPGFFRMRDVALQADGKLVIAGTYLTSSVYDFALVRLLPNGTLDPTFDGDGLVTSDFGVSELGSSVIVLADGRIVLGGYRSPADFALVRYLPNGALDPSFGNGGLVSVSSGAPAIADQLLRLPNGKLLLAGFTVDSGAEDFLLARFQPDGALDTSFGTAGFLRTDFAAGSRDECSAVAVAGPDLILTAGMSAGVSPGSDFALARYIATTPVELLGFEVE